MGRTEGQKFADFGEVHSYLTKNAPDDGLRLCAEQTEQRMAYILLVFLIDGLERERLTSFCNSSGMNFVGG